MRFSAKNYERAFPRDQVKPVKVEVATKPGNVIEEAEKAGETEPEPEIEETTGSEEIPEDIKIYKEGSED